VVTGETPDRDLWFLGYEQTYLERDVRGLSQVADLVSFRNLLRLAACRTGQILNQSELARDAMFAFPVVESPLSEDVFQLAVDLYRSARRAGLTIRSSTDCLIGACALRSSLVVCHRDRDFDALARIAPLEVLRI